MSEVEQQPATRTLRSEVLLVLGLSLGAAAAYALVRFVGAVTAPGGLADQEAALNVSRAPDRPWLDLALQLLGIAFGIVPALLAVHLLQRDHAPAVRTLGLDVSRRHARWDLGGGVLLALAIGLPGLGLYLAAQAAGVNATVVAAGLPDEWWRVPVLILAAAQNAVLEEVVVVGYLLTRLGDLGWSPRRALVASAVLRGAYHLYQGVGGFVGNLVMGLVFGWLYQRYQRVLPLVIAHTLLDVAAFVGYAALRGRVDWLP